MATTCALIEGWRLDDDILSPLPLPAPLPVIDALAGGGVLEDVATGLHSLGAEWVFLRAWRYRVSFELPEEWDERSALRFANLRGCGSLSVNGEPVTRFLAGPLFADITGLIHPGRNEAELIFDPQPRALPGSGAPLAKIGLSGAAYLETYNYLMVEHISVDGRMCEARGDLTFRLSLNAFTAGKYVFRYMISGDEGAVESEEFVERLPAARRVIEHVLSVRNASVWSKRDRASYDWRLSIERSGIGCQTLRGSAAFFPESEPKPVIRISDGILARPDDRMDDWLDALGMDAVSSDDRVSVTETHLYGDRFRLANSGNALTVPAALRSGDCLRALAGGEAHWPPDVPAWRLRGNVMPDLDEYEANFGAGVSGDADRMARITRFLQAEDIVNTAIRARIEGKAACFSLIERYPHFASSELIEFDGALRPAFWALRSAWKPVRGHILPPPGAWAHTDDWIELDIWALTDTPVGMCSITATAYRVDGDIFQSISLPLMLDGNQQAGKLKMRLPEYETLITLRTEITSAGGALLDRSDTVLAVYHGEFTMSAALNPPRAQLRATASGIRNDSDVAALGVSCARLLPSMRYGTLLPGEEMPLSGADLSHIEWFN